MNTEQNENEAAPAARTEFTRIIIDMTNDLLLTFPELKANLHTDLKNIVALNDVDSSIGQGLHQSPIDLRTAWAAVLRHHSAAPMISTEGFAEALWPNLNAPIGDHLQLQRKIAYDRNQFFREVRRSSVVFLNEDIDAHQILLCAFEVVTTLVMQLEWCAF